ncbi:MAG: helix-turn-helix domain-containing protein [Bryobacteraceae bacterium]
MKKIGSRKWKSRIIGSMMNPIAQMPDQRSGLLREARIGAGMTQQELAGEINVTQATISNWENGSTPIPEAQWNQLCQVLPSLRGKAAQPDGNRIEDGDDMNDLSLGYWLRSFRERHNLTRQQVAERCGLSPLTISNIEEGLIDKPQKRTISKLKELAEQYKDTPPDVPKEEPLEIPGVGELVEFDPHDPNSLPEDCGVYVFYDRAQRPVYIGKAENIRKRILSSSGHNDKFWFRAPVVQFGAYVKIADKQLRSSIEKLLIQFLRSGALINKQLVVDEVPED